MADIFSDFRIKGHVIKNRVVLPPMVTPHYSGADGLVTNRNISHYNERAQGGFGLMIVEATAVQEQGRLATYQLGLWDDKFIPGMGSLAKEIKQTGAVALVQIHHAGLVTPETVSPFCLAPSEDPQNPRSRMLSVTEIGTIRHAFTAAAIRAQKSGFDGVEIHGAHGYLLGQFASDHFNRRTDDYGGSLENRLRLATGIIRDIQEACGNDFIVGYRMGANAPLLEDGIAIAKHLEALGIDYLHVSHGGSLMNLPRPPKDFEFNWIVYSGTVVKASVSLPVITVNEIKTAERANYLVENGMADFVAIGRPALADPEWVNHVRNQEPVNICSSCKPKCRWYENSDLCPARIRLMEKSSGRLPD
jgi:2,4-dienoyl-CoA reductase-like NADH-dependent reductase (Old Yellow Enzyme family)